MGLERGRAKPPPRKKVFGLQWRVLSGIYENMGQFALASPLQILGALVSLFPDDLRP